MDLFAGKIQLGHVQAGHLAGAQAVVEEQTKRKAVIDGGDFGLDEERLPARLREQFVSVGNRCGEIVGSAGEPPRAIAVGMEVPVSSVYRLLAERGVLQSRSEAPKVVHSRRKAPGAG